MSDGKNKDYAIVIGITAYVGLPPLNSAVTDAVNFANWLRREDGGGLTGPGQVDVVLGETFYHEWLEAKPSADTIKTKLYNLGINRGEKIGRRLYIYFSGHGFTNNADEIAMAMANAGSGSFNNSLSLNSFHNLFKQVGYFEQVVFILDCCREQSKYNFTPQSIFDVEYFQNLFNDKNGTANSGDSQDAGAEAVKVPKVRDLFVLASAYGEKSYAPTDKDFGKRRGLLTKALLEGLEGGAALSDGSITAASLREFIEKRVKELAGENKVPQEAQINNANSEGIFFKEVDLTQPKVETPEIFVKIKIDKKVEGNVTLYDRNKVFVFGTEQIKQSDYVWDIPFPLEKRFAPPYILHSDNPAFSDLLDLSNAVVGEAYEFSFHQSEK